MEPPPPTSIEVYFGHLPDPRVERTRVHRLTDLLTIALCAILCGANDWVAVETFGHAKEAWLRTFLALPSGIPSHDTFGRVFARLDPAALQHCFVAWVQAVVGELPAQVVAIDGKTSRGSADRSRGQAALHLVSAWATASGLVLGQEATDAKSNEITAIPRLLRLLALDGCVVTMDAMGCQRTIAAQLQEQGADYVLALKGNQPTLHATVAAAFAETHTTAAGAWQPVEQDAAQTLDGGHGRVERRRYTALSDPDLLACLDPTGTWPGHGASERAALLSGQSAPRRGAARSGDSSPLGHRESAALGARCPVPRRRQCGPGRRGGAYFHRPAPARPQPDSAGSHGPRQHRQQALPRSPRRYLPRSAPGRACPIHQLT